MDFSFAYTCDCFDSVGYEIRIVGERVVKKHKKVILVYVEDYDRLRQFRLREFKKSKRILSFAELVKKFLRKC